MRHLQLFLVALDVAVNVLLCVTGAVFTLDLSMVQGSWNTTLSARAWLMEVERKPWGLVWRPLIDELFFWQPNHCHTQYLRENAAGGVWASFNTPSA